jgi:hypothetical protein
MPNALIGLNCVQRLRHRKRQARRTRKQAKNSLNSSLPVDHSTMRGVISFSILMVWVLAANSLEITVQNGANGYSSCKEAAISNSNGDLGLSPSAWNWSTRLILLNHSGGPREAHIFSSFFFLFFFFLISFFF